MTIIPIIMGYLTLPVARRELIITILKALPGSRIIVIEMSMLPRAIMFSFVVKMDSNCLENYERVLDAMIVCYGICNIFQKEKRLYSVF